MNANASAAHRQRVHVRGGRKGRWSKDSERMNYRIWWLKQPRTVHVRSYVEYADVCGEKKQNGQKNVIYESPQKDFCVRW